MSKLFVRIKPYNPKRGYKVQRYTVFGIKFDVAHGWYTVDADVGQYLRTVHQDNNDPETPNVFDVCTKQEAQEIMAAERRAERMRGEVHAPIEVTATDRTAPTMKKFEEPKRATASLADIEAPAEPEEDLSDLNVSLPAPPSAGDMTTADLPMPPRLEPAENVVTNETVEDNLMTIAGVGDSLARKLISAGFTTIESVAKADESDLKKIVGHMRAGAIIAGAQAIHG